MNHSPNVDPVELDKFAELAARWWDPQGPMAPLHGLNPLRLAFIERHRELAGRRVLDAGCGGGILSEAMARRGAQVDGIDLTTQAIEVAQLHQLESGLSINYRCLAIEDLAAQDPASYELVTCMELLEHVPDPAAFVTSCAALTRPGGELVFSTINRNPKAFALAIIGAEYVLDLVPRGTHDYERFIRPSELAAWCRAASLEVLELAGLGYNPISKTFSLHDDVSVNYLLRCRRNPT